MRSFSCVGQIPHVDVLSSVVNELGSGIIHSYAVDSQGSLSGPLDTVSTGGEIPAYAAALTDGRVGVMNYASGTGRILKTTSSGSKFDDTAPVINFLQPGEEDSNPHQIVEYNNEFSFQIEVKTRSGG